MFDQFEIDMDRQALRYAAGRKMFCKCGEILDADDAVMLVGPSGAAIDCTRCFDKSIEKKARQHRIAYVSVIRAMEQAGIEITDSRILEKKERAL